MKKQLLLTTFFIAVTHSTPIFAIVGPGVPTDGYTSGETCTQIAVSNTNKSSCTDVTDCYVGYTNFGGTTILSCSWAGPGKYATWSMAIEPTRELKDCTNPKTNANVSEYTFTTSGGGMDNCAWFANCAPGSYFDMNTEKCVACTNTQIAPKVKKDAIPENFIINDTVYTINRRGTNLWGMYGPQNCITCPTGSTPNNDHDECIANTGHTCTATNGTYFATAYTCSPQTYPIKFNPNGGYLGNVQENMGSYTYNSHISINGTQYTDTIKNKLPILTHHTFLGYFTAQDGGTQLIDATGKINKAELNSFVTTTNSNRTIYAQWKRLQFYIRYSVNGVEYNPGIPHNFGDEFTIADKDTIIKNIRKNTTTQWFKVFTTDEFFLHCKGANGTPEFEPGEIITAESKCFPNTSQDGITITLTAKMLDCGTIDSTNNVTGTSSNWFNCNCTQGYFLKNEDGPCEPKIITITLDSNNTTETTYSQCKTITNANPKTIYYKYKNGFSTSENGTFANTIDITTLPARAGYEFDGFCDTQTPNGNSAVYNNGQSFKLKMNNFIAQHWTNLTDNKTLYAYYKPREYTIAYKMETNSTNVEQISYTGTITIPHSSNKAFKDLPKPTDTPVFLNWKNGTTTIKSGAQFTPNCPTNASDPFATITLVAEWQSCPQGYYNCRYDTDDSNLKKEACPAGSTTDGGGAQTQNQCYLNMTSSPYTKLLDTTVTNAVSLYSLFKNPKNINSNPPN